MNKLLFKILIFLLFLSSCSTLSQEKKRTPTNDNDEPIVIFTDKDSIPNNAEELGYFKHKYNLLFKDCGFEKVIKKMKKEASKQGGNSIKIETYKAINGLGEGCHSIKAKILFIKSLDSILKNNNKRLYSNTRLN